MGVKSHFLFSLGRHSKQGGEERHLAKDISFVHLLLWLLEASAEKMESLISSVTS
jgi:hypothetical protein